MRILFVAPMDRLHAQRWVRYFAGKDYDVHVITVDKPGNVAIEKTNFHALKLGRKRLFLFIDYLLRFLPFKNKIMKLIDEIRPDLIHVHWIDSLAFTVASCGYHPLVASAWGSDIRIFSKKTLRSRYMTKLALKKADMITCDGIQLTGEMSRMGIDRGKMRIILFGTDTTLFNPLNRDPGIRKELGFDPGTKLVISLRGFYSIYNNQTFINAIPHVLMKIPAARFILIGTGPEKEMCENLAGKLGVDDKVKFTGRLSDEDMFRYIASADAYVSTSLYDSGLSASTAEAMVSGVPVIISDVYDNRDWVEDGKSGLLFKPEDNEMLADKIILLLKDPDLAKRISKKGREVIKKRLNWHIEMKKVEVLYSSLVQEKGQKS